mmetsp:Transcript_6799/g.11766  ORF Transcript_6799/g.11766 Transcript_6799/m.11766 type:complete len:284 (-) Transcript_6799:144-995(-)
MFPRKPLNRFILHFIAIFEAARMTFGSCSTCASVSFWQKAMALAAASRTPETELRRTKRMVRFRARGSNFPTMLLKVSAASKRAYSFGSCKTSVKASTAHRLSLPMAQITRFAVRRTSSASSANSTATCLTAFLVRLRSSPQSSSTANSAATRTSTSSSVEANCKAVTTASLLLSGATRPKFAASANRTCSSGSLTISLTRFNPLRWPPRTSQTLQSAKTAKRRTLQCSWCSFGVTASIARSNFRMRSFRCSSSSVPKTKARKALMAPRRGAHSDPSNRSAAT